MNKQDHSELIEVTDSERAEQRKGYLLFPNESQLVDYKRGMRFITGDEYSTMLVKHILGMCNAGGGFIIIGYEENSDRVLVRQKLDESVLASYDLSSMAQFIEKFTAGTDKIEILVHKDTYPETNDVYPIIEVIGFRKRPFFCKSSANKLEVGALYLRIASARTIRIAEPDDWDSLIDVCVERRQSDMLRRFTSLLSEMGLNSANVINDDDKDEKQNKLIQDIQAQLHEKGLSGGLEIWHWPKKQSFSWMQDRLLQAAEKAERSNTGWPLGVVIHNAELGPKAVDNGIKATLQRDAGKIDYWFLSSEGIFYLYRALEEDYTNSPSYTGSTKVLWHIWSIWRIAEAVDHCISLYKELGLEPEEKIHITIRFGDLKGRSLANSEYGAGSFINRVAEADASVWSFDGSIDYLQSNFEEIVSSACEQLFLLFRFFRTSSEELRNQLTAYKNAGGRNTNSFY